MSEIVEQVRAAGVVGAGGAGFPTHIKLQAQAEIYIVNGAECEPMLKTDQQLVQREAEKLVKGLAAAMQATGANAGIIALKAKYKESIAKLTPLLQANMRIGILPDIYPAGDEVITIWLLTGRRVPPGGLPIDIGVVVNNVQTLINLADALEGKPVITRTLTVTGAVKFPKTVTVPIGVTLQGVLDLAGGPLGSGVAYLEGGPMMGKLVADLNKPVTKITGGLIALPADHPLILKRQMSLQAVLRIAQTVCEQCCYCTDLCPRHLIGHELPPHLIIRAVSYNRLGDPQVLNSALTCSECGVCEAYACPVGISPMRVNRALKAELRSKGVKYGGQLGAEQSMAKSRLIPSSRLVARLGIKPWYVEAPFKDVSFEAQQVHILLTQHIGAPAIPVVQKGDSVTAGQLLGEIPEGKLGARVHASIAGTVVNVTGQGILIQKGGRHV